MVSAPIRVAALLDRLQRDMPRRLSPPADICCAAGGSAAPSYSSTDSAGLNAVDCRDDADFSRRSGRRSLTRHSAALPHRGIPAAEFGSYLKFVNREQECEALVTHLQTCYLSFVQRVQRPLAARAEPGEYLKAMHVIYSAGAPGIGKVSARNRGENGLQQSA